LHAALLTQLTQLNIVDVYIFKNVVYLILIETRIVINTIQQKHKLAIFFIKSKTALESERKKEKA